MNIAGCWLVGYFGQKTVPRCQHLISEWPKVFDQMFTRHIWRKTHMFVGTNRPHARFEDDINLRTKLVGAVGFSQRDSSFCRHLPISLRTEPWPIRNKYYRLLTATKMRTMMERRNGWPLAWTERAKMVEMLSGVPLAFLVGPINRSFLAKQNLEGAIIH